MSPERAGSRSLTYRGIYAAVARIPRGRVATYGQIASLAKLEGHARLVGYALHALPEGAPVPWHRVVNAKGMVSRRRSGSGHDVLQRRMLEAEGVRFDGEGRLPLGAFRWRPRERHRLASPIGTPNKTATPRRPNESSRRIR